MAFFLYPFVFSFALMRLHNFNICSLMCLSFSNVSIGSLCTGPRSLQTNKQKYPYSYRYIQQFHILSIPAIACLIPLTVFKTVTMSCQTTQQFYFPWSCSSNSELWTHITTGRTLTPYKYTQHTISIVTPQPEGPNNTLIN